MKTVWVRHCSPSRPDLSWRPISQLEAAATIFLGVTRPQIQ